MKPVLLLFVFCCIFGSPSRAETIRVVTEYLDPYQIKNADGSLGGYMTEVVEAMFHITGDTAKIEVMPWARAFHTAKNESDVLIYSIVETDERREHFHWIGKIPTEVIYLWALKSKFAAPVSALDELKPYRVSVLRGSNVYHFLQQQKFPNLVPLSEESQLLKMLRHERVDLVVGTGRTIVQRMRREKFPEQSLTQVLELSDLNAYLSLAFNIHSSPELVARYRKAYTQLVDSGELANISKKWKGEFYASKSAPQQTSH